jgi:uncharacterized protein
MSQENVEVVRRAIAGYNRIDVDLVEELFDPDVRLEPILAGVEGVTYRGRTGILEWRSQLDEIFAEVHADYSRIEESGDVVLVTGKTTGQGRTSGVPIEQHWVAAVRLRQGKISYVAFCRTRAEALEAAGLRE